MTKKRAHQTNKTTSRLGIEPPKNSTRVTIVDIAKEVGLASSTISRALNNHESINPHTRALVLETATRMGYRASSSARTLLSGKTHSLGLIIPDIRLPFFAEIAKAAQARARVSNLAVYIADSEYDPILEAELVSAMRRDIDGVLLCSPRGTDQELITATKEIPTVVIHRDIPGIPSVVTNQVDGMRQAVSHLRALGHEQIAYLSGPRDSWNASQRLLGFKAARPHQEDLIFGPIVDEFEGGIAYADAIHASRATAVIAYNDISALGISARLKSRGVSIPKQLSIVGFDGLAVSTITMSLSSISLPRELSAQTAVDLLKQIIEDPQSKHPDVLNLPTELLVRESTAPLHGF